MLDCQDHIGGERPFEAAAHRHAVDRGDDGLVEIGQLLDAAEAARPVILIRPLASRRGLQIPAGAEELLAAAGDDGDPQLRVVAEFHEGLAHDPAGGGVDGIGLGTVEHHLEDGAVAGDVERSCAQVSAPDRRWKRAESGAS